LVSASVSVDAGEQHANEWNEIYDLGQASCWRYDCVSIGVRAGQVRRVVLTIQSFATIMEVRMFRATIASLVSLLTLCSVTACEQSSVGSASNDLTQADSTDDDGSVSCATTEECDPDGDYGLYCAFEVDACEAQPGLFGTCQATA